MRLHENIPAPQKLVAVNDMRPPEIGSTQVLLMTLFGYIAHCTEVKQLEQAMSVQDKFHNGLKIKTKSAVLNHKSSKREPSSSAMPPALH